tara:strand:- start:217 stop:573 length:357 start_codon:yes stop_codon:yes gene_type:complete
MPASPITKKVTLPDNWVHLQKTMIPDSNTCCYWSVWYDVDGVVGQKGIVGTGTAWLMWCPMHDDPSVNDSWGHAEEIDDSCRNVLTTIESVYGVSFHDSIWVEMGKEEAFPHSNRSNL